MPYSISMDLGYRESGDTAGGPQTVTIACDGLDKRDLTVADSTVNQQILIDFTLASLQCYYLVSDKAVTLKTNSSSAPDDTINLVANEPFAWNNLSLHAKKFTADVTTLYVSNSSGGTANLKIRIGKDSTP